MTPTEAKNEIPRIIHFIWLGSETPPEVSLRIEKFTSLNPNWKVILWRDGDLDWLLNKNEFETGSTWQAKANIARYEILLRHGGYYFDTDFDPQQSLDPIRSLVGSRQLVFCREREGVINNAFIGSVPESPFLADLIRKLPSRVKTFPNSSSQFATGPEFLTQYAHEWLLHAPEEIAFIPRDWLYPFTFDRPGRRTGPWSSQVIAVHQWAQWDSGPAHVSKLGPKANVAKRVGQLRRRINVRAKLRRVRSQLWAVKHSIRFQPNSLSTGPESAITINRSGNPISFPTNDLNVVAHLLTDGVYDPNFHAFLRRILHGSDTYVDVGANIGQFVITASQCLSPYGRVFAFEPNPEVFKHLEANVYMCRMTGRVSCEVETSMFAMGPVAEIATLRVPLRHTGRGSITLSALTDLKESEIKRVDVQVETLSERLGSLSHIRLLKIDVEGAELSVLQGAHQIIESQLIDYIDLEFLPQHLGSDTQPLLDWIQSWVDRGAQLHSIRRRGRLSPVNFQQMKANPPSLSHLVIQMPRVAKDNQELLGVI